MDVPEAGGFTTTPRQRASVIRIERAQIRTSNVDKVGAFSVSADGGSDSEASVDVENDTTDIAGGR